MIQCKYVLELEAYDHNWACVVEEKPPMTQREIIATNLQVWFVSERRAYRVPTQIRKIVEIKMI